MLYYFIKGKNATETQKKVCAMYIEKVRRLMKCVKHSLLVLLTFWPNNSLLWSCLMQCKVFSSTLGLYPLEANGGDSQHTQNIHINKVIGKNEKCVLSFTEKPKWTFWPTQYFHAYLKDI